MSNRKGNPGSGRTNKHFRSAEYKRQARLNHLEQYATARDIQTRIIKDKQERDDTAADLAT